MAECQPVWSDLLPLQTNADCPSKLWDFWWEIRSLLSPCPSPSRHQRCSLCCGFTFRTQMSVAETTAGCFGSRASLQRQNLRGCPGDFISHTLGSGRTLLTGLRVSHRVTPVPASPFQTSCAAAVVFLLGAKAALPGNLNSAPNLEQSFGNSSFQHSLKDRLSLSLKYLV